MTLKHRRGEESSHIPFRTGRIYYVNDQWFFCTREGHDEGPYPSRDEAEAALAMYIRDTNTMRDKITGSDKVGPDHQT